jgi:hypothetical protein
VLVLDRGITVCEQVLVSISIEILHVTLVLGDPHATRALARMPTVAGRLFRVVGVLSVVAFASSASRIIAAPPSALCLLDTFVVLPHVVVVEVSSRVAQMVGRCVVALVRVQISAILS